MAKFNESEYRETLRRDRSTSSGLKFFLIILATLVFDIWLVLYVLAPLLDKIADWFVRRTL